MGAIRWEGPGQLEVVNNILNTPPVSWNIPLLGMSKYEKVANDLMWNVFKLQVDLKNEFNP